MKCHVRVQCSIQTSEIGNFLLNLIIFDKFVKNLTCIDELFALIGFFQTQQKTSCRAQFITNIREPDKNPIIITLKYWKSQFYVFNLKLFFKHILCKNKNCATYGTLQYHLLLLSGYLQENGFPQILVFLLTNT